MPTDFDKSLYNESNKIFDIREFAHQIDFNLINFQLLRNILDSFPDENFIKIGPCVYVRKCVHADKQQKKKIKKRKNKHNTKLIRKTVEQSEIQVKHSSSCDSDIQDKMQHLFLSMTIVLFLRFMLNRMWNYLFD